MEKRIIACLAVVFVAFSWGAHESAAQDPRGKTSTAASCSTPVAYKEVEQTLLVPTLVTEARKVCSLEFRTEQRQQTFTVCRPVFETKNIQVTCCVGVPEWRTRTEKCLVCKPVTRQVTQEYTVPGCKPETRTRTVSVCDFVSEEQSREVKYLVCVPQLRTQTVPVTTLIRLVPEQRTITCTVAIPYMAEKDVQVQVCKYVPKTIKVKVPVQPPCNPGPAPCRS